MWNKIQFGVDIATSLTIIGAFISWMLSNRRRARIERERGISEQARAIAAEKIQDTVWTLARSFNQIVQQAQTIENPIDRRLADGNIDGLVRVLERDETLVLHTRKHIDALRDSLGDFYEACTTHRYLLFPVLYTLPEGKDAVEIIKTDFRHISDSYNKLSSGWIKLFGEFDALVKHSDELRQAQPDLTGQALFPLLHGKIQSIVFDEDYAEWVQTFVPPGRRDDFLREYKAPEVLDAQLCLEVMANLMGSMLEQRHRLYAHLLVHASQQVQRCRIECKEVLCTLGGIASRLLSRGDNESIPTIIEELRSERYFALDKEIR